MIKRLNAPALAIYSDIFSIFTDCCQEDSEKVILFGYFIDIQSTISVFESFYDR